MAQNQPADDAAARQARAESIRRTRDQRSGGLATPAAEASDDAAESGREPNYVDMIDRKMKEMEED